MLKRKMYDEMLAWKEARRKGGLRKCLLLLGARQVGKSFLVRAFGNKEYASFIEIDFFRNRELKKIFDGDLSPEEVYKRLSVNISGVRLIPGDTLLFLDEIQCCGNARTALKFLAEDMRFDVVASGSLLGLSYGEDADDSVEFPASLPVGYEHQLTMYSLDFEEFLWAYGYDEETIRQLKEYVMSEETIPLSVHERFEGLFREFMVVGGMPEVVSDFAVNKDFSRVFDIQKSLVDQYQDDISKHAKGLEKQAVRRCYDAVPRQLAKEIKKFQYSTVEKGQTRRKYGSSVKWLKDSGLVNVCTNVSEPLIPLMANEKEEQFKLYLNDTGLLTALYGFETKKAIINDTIRGNARGGVYENIIAESLVKRGYSLHYFKPDDNTELEFLIEKDGEVVPVEVKAGNTASRSLKRFIEKYHPEIAYKLISGRNGRSDEKWTLPHYSVIFL